MEKVQKLSNSECYTPSSEPFIESNTVELQVRDVLLEVNFRYFASFSFRDTLSHFLQNASHFRASLISGR
jgi:hypothetical protein